MPTEGQEGDPRKRFPDRRKDGIDGFIPSVRDRLDAAEIEVESPTEGQERCTCLRSESAVGLLVAKRDPKCPVHGQERRECPTCGSGRPEACWIHVEGGDESPVIFTAVVSSDALRTTGQKAEWHLCPDPFHDSKPEGERCTCGTGAKSEAEWLEPRQPDSDCPVHGQERWVCGECGLELPQPSEPAPRYKSPASVDCPNGHGPMQLTGQERRECPTCGGPWYRPGVVHVGLGRYGCGNSFHDSKPEGEQSKENAGSFNSAASNESSVKQPLAPDTPMEREHPNASFHFPNCGMREVVARTGKPSGCACLAQWKDRADRAEAMLRRVFRDRREPDKIAAQILEVLPELVETVQSRAALTTQGEG